MATTPLYIYIWIGDTEPYRGRNGSHQTWPVNDGILVLGGTHYLTFLALHRSGDGSGFGAVIWDTVLVLGYVAGQMGSGENGSLELCSFLLLLVLDEFSQVMCLLLFFVRKVLCRVNYGRPLFIAGI